MTLPKFDTHIHTRFSFDSTEALENYVQKAIENGYQEITITDHNDLVDRNLKTAKLNWQDEFPVPAYTLESYHQQKLEIHNINKKYRGQLIVKHGMELGLHPDREDYLQILKSMSLDFVLGSIHNPWNYVHTKMYQDMTPYEMQHHYFDTMLRACQNLLSGFDVLAHFDFISRYGTDNYNTIQFSRLKELIAEILTLVISNGKGLEINPGLFKKGLNYPHPMPEIISLYKDLGGDILTLGSDCHKVADFHDINLRNKSIAYVVAHRFKYLCTYAKRKPIHHKIL